MAWTKSFLIIHDVRDYMIVRIQSTRPTRRIHRRVTETDVFMIWGINEVIPEEEVTKDWTLHVGSVRNQSLVFFIFCIC